MENPQRVTMNVSMPRQLARWVEARVKSGRYSSASEVVRDAIRALQNREKIELGALDDVRARIAEGVRQADRGEFIDGEKVFAELARKSRQRRRKAG